MCAEFDASSAADAVTDDEGDEHFLHPLARSLPHHVLIVPMPSPQHVGKSPATCILSYGSRLHSNGCKPCSFHFDRKGCKNGSVCGFCHHPDQQQQRLTYRSGRERKRLQQRQQERRGGQRALAHSTGRDMQVSDLPAADRGQPDSGNGPPGTAAPPQGTMTGEADAKHDDLRTHFPITTQLPWTQRSSCELVLAFFVSLVTLFSNTWYA